MPNAITHEDKLRKTIAACLDLENPRSFFLYAGAGSGKTRAVVEAMKIFRERYGELLRLSGRNAAIITYTNAACDEISRRIDFDPIFAVSTIHSFAWELIRTYNKDISVWLRSKLEADVSTLHEKQASSDPGSKAYAQREVEIESKQKRLQHLDGIKRFTYNPNGENIDKNSLNHAEVIAISAAFLTDKPLMRDVLVRKYPVLLIDESQDTQKDLIDGFFQLQQQNPNKFSLSLFGDTMQRIYADGKIGLEQAVPKDWEKPVITINFRCPKRIVRLINRIRSDADGHQQEPRVDAPEGFVRLFLVQDNADINKTAVEEEIRKTMAEVTSDDKWAERPEVKTLTLEHHMAARRGGFSAFFEPLYGISNFRTGLLDGSLSGIAFLARQVLPLVDALQAQDKFAVARIVRNFSPILSADKLKDSQSSLKDIRSAQDAVQLLFHLWKNDADPFLIDVLKVIADSNLFAVPDVFAPILKRDDVQGQVEDPESPERPPDTNPEIDAWEQALSARFSHLRSYVEYRSDRSPFGTHQGIKGLEFPRVMVILDDNEARGFMFSYDKLLGAKLPTETDKRNMREGKETAIERTRRLLYVTCSRAKRSLAVVVYTAEKRKIANRLSELAWFEDDEIVEIVGDQLPA